MTEDQEIHVGDQVKLDGGWYTVKKIREENVKTVKAGTLIFKRLYFKEPHSPAWFHEIKLWRKGNSDTLVERE